MATSSIRSAGILLYRRSAGGEIEVLVGHMGGPFWAHKEAAAWSIPKGIVEGDDDDLATALREFEEETGSPPPDTTYKKLGEFRYSSGKVVAVFCAESDFGVERTPAHTVTIEWPKGSGRTLSFPELDRLEWCSLDAARERLVAGQRPALGALKNHAEGD